MDKLVPLRAYQPLNYVRPGTVAYQRHRRALHARTGPSHTVHLLADAAFKLAERIGSEGDRELGPVVNQLLEALVRLLGLDAGDWDPGTVDAWARDVAQFVGEPLE